MLIGKHRGGGGCDLSADLFPRHRLSSPSTGLVAWHEKHLLCEATLVSDDLVVTDAKDSVDENHVVEKGVCFSPNLRKRFRIRGLDTAWTKAAMRAKGEVQPT